MQVAILTSNTEVFDLPLAFAVSSYYSLLSITYCYDLFILTFNTPLMNYIGISNSADLTKNLSKILTDI